MEAVVGDAQWFISLHMREGKLGKQIRRERAQRSAAGSLVTADCAYRSPAMRESSADFRTARTHSLNSLNSRRLVSLPVASQSA